MKALVIADNKAVVESISLPFQQRWPQATLLSIADGNNGVELVAAQWPDIVILDLDLLGTDGFNLLEQISLFSNMPLIALTSREDEIYKVWALELGADSCMAKPLRHIEFCARVEALLRRSCMAE